MVPTAVPDAPAVDQLTATTPTSSAAVPANSTDAADVRYTADGGDVIRSVGGLWSAPGAGGGELVGGDGTGMPGSGAGVAGGGADGGATGGTLVP